MIVQMIVCQCIYIVYNRLIGVVVYGVFVKIFQGFKLKSFFVELYDLFLNYEVGVVFFYCLQVFGQGFCFMA